MAVVLDRPPQDDARQHWANWFYKVYLLLKDGVSSSTTFLGLTDTPSSYSGQQSKVLRVKGDETSVEFVDLDTDDVDEGTTNLYYPGMARTFLLMGG